MRASSRRFTVLRAVILLFKIIIVYQNIR